MVPGVAGLAAVQINLFVNSWLATGLGTGAVSWLDYAFRLMYMPIGLFGISIATASLPDISGHAADRDDPRRPAGGVERAAHDADAERAGDGRAARAGDADRRADLRARPVHRRPTPRPLPRRSCVMRPGSIGYSAVKLVSPAFYALGNSRIPVIASAASVAFNVALNLDARSIARPSRPRARHGGGRAAERRPASVCCCARGWEASRAAACSSRRVKISLASIAMALAAYYSERVLHVPFGGDDAHRASGPCLRRDRHRHGRARRLRPAAADRGVHAAQTPDVSLLNVVDST